MHMAQPHISTFVSCKWYLCFLLVSIFSGVKPSPTPEANLLCISECGTCPLICSPPPQPPSIDTKPPPPPPIESKPPPLPIESKPPPSPKGDDSEPPPYLTPIYHATPPQSHSPPLPPPTPRPRAKSCPPPSYITMGTNAPPPPPKLVVVPSTQIPTGGHPYYYFYASKGVGFSLDFSGFVIVLVSFHVVFIVLG